MKQITKAYVRKTLKDTWWVSLAIANIVMTVIAVLIIAVSIQPKETQVFTHYSAFGITGLYKGYWYSLWNYAILAVVILIAHGIMSVKLRQMDRRDLSLALLWGTFPRCRNMEAPEKGWHVIETPAFDMVAMQPIIAKLRGDAGSADFMRLAHAEAVFWIINILENIDAAGIRRVQQRMQHRLKRIVVFMRQQRSRTERQTLFISQSNAQ